MYKTYDKMKEAEEREFLSQLVDNVQFYEERKENGQWLKSIEFKLLIIEKEFRHFERHIVFSQSERKDKKKGSL